MAVTRTEKDFATARRQFQAAKDRVAERAVVVTGAAETGDCTRLETAD